MIDAIRTLPGVHFQDLYEAYPEFNIDVPHQQRLLAANDVIIMQYPFFWYSIPAIIKERLDLVLEHNWAYGSHATALHGK